MHLYYRLINKCYKEERVIIYFKIKIFEIYHSQKRHLFHVCICCFFEMIKESHGSYLYLEILNMMNCRTKHNNIKYCQTSPAHL